MMKRFFGWFLTGLLTLLSCAALAAPQPVLVTLTDDAGDLLAHGVAVLDGQAVLAPLTAKDAAAAQAEHTADIGGVLAEDGNAVILSLAEAADWSGAALSDEPLKPFRMVTVAGPGAEPHQAQLMTRGMLAQGIGFLLQDAQAQPGSVLLDASGAVQGLVTAPWQGMSNLWQVVDTAALRTLLLLQDAQAQPGSVLLDASGAVQGLVTAPWQGMSNLWQVVDTAALRTLLTRAQQGPDASAPSAEHFLADFQLTGHSGGAVDISWDESLGSKLPSGYAFHVRCRNIHAPFYHEIIAYPGQSSVRMAMQPGCTVQACIWVGPEADHTTLFPEDEALTAVLTLDAARPFHKYSYEQEMAIRAGDAQQVLDAAALARGDALSLELDIRYRVKRDTVCPMLLSLTTPDGVVFELDGTMDLISRVTEAQVSVNLEDLQTMHQQLRPEWLPGEYTLHMYLEGALAGELTFQVE